jgi:hypothetical protein
MMSALGGTLFVAWGIMPVILALLLAAPTVTLPEVDRGLRRFLTPPLAPDLQLSQNFTMTADGLYAIDVFPAPVSGPSSGQVRFELYDTQDDGTEHWNLPLLAVDVPVGRLRSASTYRLEFAPIRDSNGHSYRLDLRADAVSGVGFWAAKGQGYDGGSLHANGIVRWADLAFRTHAPAPSGWSLLMTRLDTSALRVSLIIAAFTAVWVLVGLVLRTLAAVPRQADAM